MRLGVDVGAARVGVASSDPAGLLATPVRTLARDAENDTDIAELAAIAAESAAMEVVVGLPRSLSGEEGAAAQTARGYARRLARRLGKGVPVTLVDERLSTVDAHRALHASGRDSRRHREVVDQVAAVMILQSALDMERESGRPPGERVGARKPRHSGGQHG